MYDRANWRHFDVLPPCIVFPLPVPMARYQTCTSLSSDRPTVRVWHVHTAPIPSDVGLRRAETDCFGCWNLVKTSETAAKCMQNPPEKLKKWKSGVLNGVFSDIQMMFLDATLLNQLNWFLLWNFWISETSFTTNNHREVHIRGPNGGWQKKQKDARVRGSSFTQPTPQQSADSKHRCTQPTLSMLQNTLISAFCFLHDDEIIASFTGSIDAIPLGVCSKCLRIDYWSWRFGTERPGHHHPCRCPNRSLRKCNLILNESNQERMAKLRSGDEWEKDEGAISFWRSTCTIWFLYTNV